jgi:hypothetical protein
MDSDSALELIDLQAFTLSISVVDGRIRYIREPDYQEYELEPALRFFVGRTLNGEDCLLYEFLKRVFRKQYN